MRTLSALLPLLLMAAALAGCTGNPAPSPQPVTPTNTTAGGDHGNMSMANGTGAANDTGIVVKSYTGLASGVTLHLGQGAAAIGSPAAQGDNGGTFDVKSGVTAIVVEVKWNSSSDKLNLFVTNPCNASSNDPTGLSSTCPPNPGNTNGTSPAKVVISDPAELNLTGTWNFNVYTDTNVQGTDFQAWTSVFYGSVPPDSYTAVPHGA